MKQQYIGIVLLVVIAGGYYAEAQSKLECDVCANFMNAFINVLISAIMAGEGSGCTALCTAVTSNPDDQKICEGLCNAVGITAFVAILNITDPSPIYICQECKACDHVDGGKATITAAFVSPASGPVKTQFAVNMAYTVTSATSPGICTSTIFPPMDGEPLSISNLLLGQDPGKYTCDWTLDTSYNVSEFPAGFYGVQFALCSGDCTTAHPYSGVYAQANSNFTITGK